MSAIGHSTTILELHFVEVAATVLQVADAAVGVQLVQQVEVYIGHKNHLRVGRGLGAHAVRGEGEVARGEDATLCILDVHVVHAGQVAHAAGDDHEALVLDGTGMGADLDAAVGILRVGQEGNEEDLHPLVGHDAGQFGELHVVAYQDAYLGAIRLEGLNHLASAQAPALDFVGGDVYLLVHLVGAVAAAEEADVVQAAVLLDEGHAARDDVDVVADSQLDEALANLVGEGGQSTDGLRLARVVELRHEGRVEVFGEEHEVALVVGHGVHEELHLLEEVVQRLVRTHLPLHQADAHRGLGRDILLRGRLVVDVVPLEEAGVVAGLLVVGQVVAHHLAHVEVVGELEGQDGVVNLLLAHLVDVFLGAHLVGILVVVGDAAAEHDGLQVQFLAQFLAVFVHAAGQAQAPVVGVHEDLDAVKDVAFRIVRVEGFLAGHLGVGMVVLHLVIIHDDGEGATHDLFVHHGHDLPFGKDGDKFLDLLARPENVASVGIYAGERLRQLVVVLHLQVAYLHFVDFHFFHSQISVYKKSSFLYGTQITQI